MENKGLTIVLVLLFSLLFNFSSYSQWKKPKLYQIKFEAENTVINFYSFYLYLKIDVDNEEFIAYSSPDPYKKIIKDAIGFPKNFIYSFRPKYKKTLLWLKGAIDDDTLHGNIVSTLNLLANSSMKFTVNNKGNLQGIFTMNATPIPFVGIHRKTKKSVSNFSAVSKAMIDTIKSNFYNPYLFDSKPFTNFFNELENIGSISKDDLDYLIASFFVFTEDSPTSHFFAQKTKIEERVTEAYSYKELIDAGRVEYNVNTNYGYIKFNSFLLADTLIQKKFITECSNKKTTNLIIDLRDCSGGDFSSILFAENFMDTTLTVGYFLGRKYYDKKGNKVDTSLLQSTPMFRGRSVKQFVNVLELKGVLKGVAEGKNKISFDKIYVLISQRTASSGEPLSYLLSKLNNTMLIGKNTAGKMLHAQPYSVSANWVVSLPAANYLTNEFKQLEGVGIPPDKEMEPEKALKYVENLIQK